jgi:hypothetical protein
MVLVQGLVAQGLKPVSTAGWFQVQFMFFNGSSSRVGSRRSQTSFYRRLIPSPVHVFSMVLVQGLVPQGPKPVSTRGWFQVQFQVFSMCRPCDPGTWEPAPNLKSTYWLSPVLTSLILFVLVLALL